MIWWKRHASEVGACCEAARIALAMALNSAGAERVFSSLKVLFGSNQDTSLSDYICGSVVSITTTPSVLMKLANKKKREAREDRVNFRSACRPAGIS
jgi:hypothetical protein